MGEKWWQELARKRQEYVRRLEQNGMHSYDEVESRVSTVHTKQDLVLLASLLDSLNEQIDCLNSQVMWIKVTWIGFLGYLIYEKFFT